MPDAFFIAVILALLATASALLLWRWAVQRQAREAAGRFLAQQISAHGTGGGLAAMSDMPKNKGVAGVAGVAGLPTDPWAPTPLALAAVHKSGLRAVEWPGWLQHVVTLRMRKRRRRLIAQLPGFIDGMVRLVTVGNAPQAAFQMAASGAGSPLREPMENVASLARAGVDLDIALRQTARDTGIEELSLLASILGVGVRYGGRTDLLLERVAGYMRDREQAGQELVAMSAEIRLSAWILGLLPLAVAGLIVLTNAPYLMRMWHDPAGRAMLIGAAGLQLLGVSMLYRLARIS